MEELSIAEVLGNKRKEKGITQEEVADYVGVSKASVSKWETGQSYPDITLLPLLAAYYNISIDALLGYKPQMIKEDIRKLCHRLSSDFANKPLDEVLAHCREIIKKYYSCFPLLLQMGSLLLNHSALAKSREDAASMIEEAKGLFIRVKSESRDAELAKQALYFEASCTLALGDPGTALDLLSGTSLPAMPGEVLLASAYQMSGKNEKAKATLQIGMYQHVVSLVSIFPSYLMLCVSAPEEYEEALKRALAMADTFQLKQLHPAMLATLYLSAAQGYALQGRTEDALELLQKYTDLVTGDIYPLRLHGDDFLNLLDDWLAETDFGTAPIRDEKTIRQSMADAVAQNPVFSVLATEFRFRSIVEKLKLSQA